MSKDAPLWVLVTNCLVGLVLLAWVAVTLGPFLAGRDALVSGMDVAFVGLCAWCGWNSAAMKERGDE